ncbi:MAG: hypothetical protein IPM42_02415 [Saprospiraceae bacterium]|nr:hypothetical protein [Saprospiraceae bacterium]
MRYIVCILFLIYQHLSIHAQMVEVIGDLKINSISQANSSDDILVKNENGIISQRDANTLGVPLSGIILSQTENNVHLLNSGFSKIGLVNLAFQQAPVQLEPDEFISISDLGAPLARTGHSAIWTGEEMIIWGGDLDGEENNFTNTGARYNLQNDEWTEMSTVGAPSPRFHHTTVWTGTEMIVWGGQNGSSVLNNGAKYNPTTDTWTSITLSGSPAGRWAHSAVWTGDEMIIWGGNASISNFTLTNTGAKYNPNTNTWATISNSGSPLPRYFHSAVWSGVQMIIWGLYNTGGKYDPEFNIWSSTTTSGAPSPRLFHSAIWTGSEMIIWGGLDSGNGLTTYNDGAKYSPGSNTWSPISLTNAPTARINHSSIWSGSEMIIWGGQLSSTEFNTGARYNPISNSWISTTLTNAPAARRSHSAVWTGTEMIIWGGISALTFSDGAKYSILSEEYLPPVDEIFYLYKKN